MRWISINEELPPVNMLVYVGYIDKTNGLRIYNIGFKGKSHWKMWNKKKDIKFLTFIALDGISMAMRAKRITDWMFIPQNKMD
jgi:hypothetical protein